MAQSAEVVARSINLVKTASTSEAQGSPDANSLRLFADSTLARIGVKDSGGNNAGMTFDTAAAAALNIPGVDALFRQYANSAAGNASLVEFGMASELITLSTSGLTTDSVANLLPANSIILGVASTVATTITTSTAWSVGDASAAARFSGNNSTLTAGTSQVGLAHWAGTVAIAQAAAAKLRITAVTSNPGAGAVRVSVYYIKFTPAAS